MAPKASRPKAKPGKGGKDPVTGLNAEIWGKKVYSDKVYYMPELGLAESMGRDSNGGSIALEFELSPKLITYTMQSKGDTESNGQQISADQSTSRFVFIGDFKFDKSKSLVSGTITETASWTYNRLSDGGVFEYGSIDRNSPISVMNLSEVTSAWEKGNRAYEYLDFNGSPEGDAKSEFQEYSSSKHFENGWWDNPFAPNLI